jgi:hypothetical protein
MLSIDELMLAEIDRRLTEIEARKAAEEAAQPKITTEPISDAQRVAALRGLAGPDPEAQVRTIQDLLAKGRLTPKARATAVRPWQPAEPLAQRVVSDPPSGPGVRTTEQRTSEPADPVVERRSVYIDSPGPYTERELEALARVQRIAYRPPIPVQLQIPSHQFEQSGRPRCWPFGHP